MKRQLWMLGAVAALMMAARVAPAAVVNIDFGLHGDHPGGPTSVGYMGTAAAPDSGTVWNNIEVVDNNAFTGAPGEFGWWSASVSQSGLLNSQGVATSVGVNAIGGGEPNTGAFAIVETATNNLAAVATDARNLMRDYLIGFGQPRQVVLNGFAPGSLVSLYLYGAGDTSNRDTEFSVTDSLGTHTATTTGTLTNDANTPVAHTLTLGADYVVLPGLVANGSGEITINYFHGAGSGEAPFNGLQAVFVPEPTSASLAVLGLFAARLLRRKR